MRSFYFGPCRLKTKSQSVMTPPRYIWKPKLAISFSVCKPCANATVWCVWAILLQLFTANSVLFLIRCSVTHGDGWSAPASSASTCHISHMDTRIGWLIHYNMLSYFRFHGNGWLCTSIVLDGQWTPLCLGLMVRSVFNQRFQSLSDAKWKSSYWASRNGDKSTNLFKRPIFPRARLIQYHME